MYVTFFKVSHIFMETSSKTTLKLYFTTFCLKYTSLTIHLHKNTTYWNRCCDLPKRQTNHVKTLIL